MGNLKSASQAAALTMDELAAITPVDPVRLDEVAEARRARARDAQRLRDKQLDQVHKLEGNARLYLRWFQADTALTMMIRTPMPAVIEYDPYGEPVFIQYARGAVAPSCNYCKQPCPKDGKKFLVVMSPWGPWCPSCAHKSAGLGLLGERGKQLRMRERRAKARSFASLTGGRTTR